MAYGNGVEEWLGFAKKWRKKCWFNCRIVNFFNSFQLSTNSQTPQKIAFFIWKFSLASSKLSTLKPIGLPLSRLCNYLFDSLAFFQFLSFEVQNLKQQNYSIDLMLSKWSFSKSFSAICIMMLMRKWLPPKRHFSRFFLDGLRDLMKNPERTSFWSI